MVKHLVLALTTSTLTFGLASANETPPSNALTPLEIFQGWESLSTEADLEKWNAQPLKGSKQKVTWVLDQSELKLSPGAGNIHTRQQFDSFELKLEWKVEAGGKGGIILAGNEQTSPSWQSGFRFQLVDNDNPDLKKDSKAYAGSCHHLVGAPKKAAKNAGLWNAARIVKQGHHYQFFLNGVKTADFVATSPKIRRQVVNHPKLGTINNYGLRKVGKIFLEDRGSEVCFRALKIRPLTSFVSTPAKRGEDAQYFMASSR